MKMQEWQNAVRVARATITMTTAVWLICTESTVLPGRMLGERKWFRGKVSYAARQWLPAQSILFLLFVALVSTPASAQPNPSAVDTNNARNNPCQDPWVSLAVSLVKTTSAGPGRAIGSGGSGECNPALYNNGHWGSYAELVSAVRARFAAGSPAPIGSPGNPTADETNRARNNPCRDPWISLAVSAVKTTGTGPGRATGSGDSGECNPALYNNGHWNNYPELVSAVRNHFSASPTLPNLGVRPVDFRVDSTALGYNRGTAPAPGRTVAYQGRQYQVVQVIAQGGGNVIAQGGGNVIAQGGGNLTVVLKLITSDGAGVVGPAGGTFRR